MPKLYTETCKVHRVYLTNYVVFDALASLENKSKLAERALIYRHQPDFEHVSNIKQRSQ